MVHTETRQGTYRLSTATCMLEKDKRSTDEKNSTVPAQKETITGYVYSNTTKRSTVGPSSTSSYQRGPRPRLGHNARTPSVSLDGKRPSSLRPSPPQWPPQRFRPYPPPPPDRSPPWLADTAAASTNSSAFAVTVTATASPSVLPHTAPARSPFFP